MKSAPPARAVFRAALFLLAIDPLFYIATAATVAFCAFRMFFASQFFAAGAGSSDLRPFFAAVPAVSVLTVPLVAFRLRPLVRSDSLPVPPSVKFAALASAALAAFAVPLALLLAVPISVSFFGDVDAGQAAAGFLGVLLYGLSASSLSLMLFAAVRSAPAALLLSALALAAVGSAHLVPLYLPVGGIAGEILRNVSFSWRFDPFGKGIIDSRSVAFYALAPVVLGSLAVLAEFVRTGRKVPGLAALFLSLSVAFLGASSEIVHGRLDVTAARRFSVSALTRSLLEKLESPLRIVYYRSPELAARYPQTDDVLAFLGDFCANAPDATLSVEDADENASRLSSMGIRGQQLQSAAGNRVEFATVYSAVVLNYLGRQSVIPFVLSAATLEYDLAQRVQQLVSGRERRVLVVSGNGRTLSEDYRFVRPWLAARGFVPEECEAGGEAERIRALEKGDSLVVLGSSELGDEAAEEIVRAARRGVALLVATSPYSVPVEDAWDVSRADDRLVPLLAGLGFEFGDSMAADVSCFPLTMQSGEGAGAEYRTENYPLWLSILPQEGAPRGMTLFWASPLILDGGAEPVIETSDLSWVFEQSGVDGHEFQTDPFRIPKTAGECGAVPERLAVAARNGNVAVVADQYFVDAMMTGFISSDESGAADMRNFEFLCAELLRLRGDGELALLMEKARPTAALYKIPEEEFGAARSAVLLLHFALLPALVAAAFVLVSVKRRSAKKGGEL